MHALTQTVPHLCYVAGGEDGHTEVVKLLLANKADVNASRHIDGATPLYTLNHKKT